MNIFKNNVKFEFDFGDSKNLNHKRVVDKIKQKIKEFAEVSQEVFDVASIIKQSEEYLIKNNDIIYSKIILDEKWLNSSEWSGTDGEKVLGELSFHIKGEDCVTILEFEIEHPK